MSKKNKYDRPKKFKDSITKLIVYIKTYIPAIIFILFASALAALLQVLGPNKLKQLTDEILVGLPQIVDGIPIINSINMDNVIRITLILVCFYATSAIINFIQSYMMAGITQKISKQMRTDINEKLNKLPIRYFDEVSFGDVLSRITNDVDMIGQTLNQSITTMVNAAVMFVGTLIMMIYNSWILALVAVLSTSIGFLIMSVIVKNTQKFFIAQQASIGELNGHIEEVYSSHNVIKAYNASNVVTSEFISINETLKNSAWKSQFLSGLMQPIMGFIGNFGYVSVSIVGAALALKGYISFGVIVAFMTYIRLFTQPLSQIAQALNRLQSGAAAGERIFEFLEEAEEKVEDLNIKRIDKVSGKVEFKNITFGYDKDNPVIKNFSDIIMPNEKVAIVGPTGAGKTTLVNLLMRFYEIDAGEILMDDINTQNILKQDLRKQFAMVLQDTWIFEGSIKENIRYNQENVSDKDIIEACKIAGIDHFIKTLPKGYDTILDDKQSLSDGEKQLITIARAIVLDAPILILDEATSSVDTRTERLIQNAMDNLSKNKTSFVIAHRLSTIKNADKILVMNEGEIVEKGDHNTLLELNGFYASLYNSQFEI